MPRPDYAHQLTDKELEALEKRIAAEYKKAATEMQAKIDTYFESFAKRDAETKELIGTIVNGKEYTEQDYRQWRLAQIGRGERMESLRDQLAERMTKANEVAAAYINDATPGIYSLNRNYAAYTIEQVSGDVGFTLWDEQTVKRLIKDKPGLMPFYPPKKAVNRGIDLAWGKKQITSQVTSGILQGESIKKLSDRLQTNIPDMNRTSAIRAARTAVTGAQNAGRIDSYHAAKEIGIDVKKKWLATLDNRTRHAHADLDGETAEVDEPFSSELGEIMFPGDPDADPSNVYNCRCTLIANLPEVDTSDAQRRARDPETGENALIDDMTYAEWAGWKDGIEQTINKENNFSTSILSKDETIAKAKDFANSHDYDNAGTLQEVRAITNENLGYDGLPTIVSASEFEELSKGKEILYRGVENGSGKTASEIVEEFKSGKLWTGNSGGAVYGNGVYFTSNEEIAKWEYAGANGKVIEIIISEDAKIADYQTIFQEYLETGIPNLIGFGEDYQIILSDVGQYAAIKGYDAIALNGYSGNDYVVLLNRTKAIVKGDNV